MGRINGVELKGSRRIDLLLIHAVPTSKRDGPIKRTEKSVPPIFLDAFLDASELTTSLRIQSLN
jgi:hypothetical protein